MNLYTFIMDFRGGTYINQLTSHNERQALIQWANKLNINEIQHLGNKTKQSFIKKLPKELDEFLPLLIDTTKNIWIFDYQFKTGFAIIHIIKTCKQ